MKKVLKILFIILIFCLIVLSNINSVQGIIDDYIDNLDINESNLINSNKNTLNYNIKTNEVKTQEYYDKKHKKDMFIYKIILSFLIVGESLVITLIQSKRKYKIMTKTFYD